jgi:hypothetical protein
MKKILILIVFAVALFSFKAPDEGMYPLSELNRLDLKKAGFLISAKDIFNPEGTSLSNAIVRIGGCTGSFVSADGLIITNHHCAFGSVSAVSTPEQDYLKNGLVAANKETEIPAKGLICKITISFEDVSEKVLAGTQGMDAIKRNQTIAQNIKALIAKEKEANKELEPEISEMFTGKTYVLFRYQLLKDIRMVYIPQRSIGEFGGETDNWVWPRHTGDFSFFRAYVAPDGTPADCSEKNVPYKPVQYLKVAAEGVNENDMVFILGYPGRTFRHQPAKFYEYHEKYMMPYISSLYDFRINSMLDAGKNDYSIALKYSSRVKSLANVTKNYKGKLQGFQRLGITKTKFEEEQALQKFIEQNPDLKKEFGDVIPQINKLYDEMYKSVYEELWLSQIYGTVPSLYVGAVIDKYSAMYETTKKEEKATFWAKEKDNFVKAINQAYSGYDELQDARSLRRMLEDLQKLDRIEPLKTAVELSIPNKNIIAYMNTIYMKNKLKDVEKIKKMASDEPQKLIKLKDDYLNLARVVALNYNRFIQTKTKRDSELSLLQAKMVDAKAKFKKVEFVPDANSTLRITYGTIKGYNPSDGVYHAPFTGVKGILEKNDTGNEDFVMPDILRELYTKQDFGNFVHAPIKDVPVGFLYNMDTTGGNSGSPILNAKGELVGVNFDRAYTATINDYAWSDEYSRSIGCDIRYVLWVMKKVAKADHLLAEMGVK